MIAQELKIGDWVLVDGEPTILTELPDDTLTFYNSETNTLKDYDYKDLRPVPLTKEILEKNGWEYSRPYNDWTYSIGDMEEFCIYEGGRGFIIKQCRSLNDLHTIAYVHELQHILWALGADDDMTIE